VFSIVATAVVGLLLLGYEHTSHHILVPCGYPILIVILKMGIRSHNFVWD